MVLGAVVLTARPSIIPGYSYVSFWIAGAEPLTSPDLADMIREAHQRGLYTALNTDGTLLTWENAFRLREAGLHYVKVSMEKYGRRVQVFAWI